MHNVILEIYMNDEYRINEEDIQAIIRCLEIHDPENADRNYAIQLLEHIQSFGSEISRSDEMLAEAIREAAKKK